MTDKLFIQDFDFHLDKLMQTKDMMALQSQNNWTLTDKRQNKNFSRFAFLEISKIRFTAHLPEQAQGLTPTQAKELQLLFCCL